MYQIFRHMMNNSGVKSNRHPSHLKGKDIGLWHAKKSRAKKKAGEGSSKHQDRNDTSQLPLINLGQSESRLIENLLHSTEQQYSVSPIPKHGFNFMKVYYKHLEDSECLQKGMFDNLDTSKCAPPRNFKMDNKLYNEMEARKKSSRFLEMQEFRTTLPAHKMQKEILDLVYNNQVVVVTGETGCGKTTQVPQFILDSYIQSGHGSSCKIVCTQPRRISAISVAERVSNERSTSCGNGGEVGYQIRFESHQPRTQGSILFCTTGIMTQHLQLNPVLDGISHVIVDEVHERDVLSDFLVMLLRDLLAVRKDLKLILMSATVNANEFSQYFANCPMIEIPGFTYPVEVHMLEDMLELTMYSPQSTGNGGMHQAQFRQIHRKKKKGENWEQKEDYLKAIAPNYSPLTIQTLSSWNEDNICLDLIVNMLKYIDNLRKDGAILVFLPGWSEISNLNKLVNEDYHFSGGRYLVIPLHSLLPTVQQREIFEKPPRGVRKIILATNIAETSITIDDVVYVIDSGKIKMKTFDPVNNIQMLQPEWVAIANVKQRRGRAGRTQPGICYHMFTMYKETELEDYQIPEMLRTSLEEIILQIKLLRLGNIETFLNKAINPPDPKAVQTSINTLKRLNALCEDETLTPLGYHLACLPVPPHIGKMILYGAIFSCLNPILSIAACLSFKEPFYIPMGQEKLVDEQKKKLAEGTFSDHLAFSNVIDKWEEAEYEGRGHHFTSRNFLSFSTLKMLMNLRRQFMGYLKKIHFIVDANPKLPEYNRNSKNKALLKAIICSGLYPNVAEVKTTNGKGTNKNGTLKAVTEDGTKVAVHHKSVNSDEASIPTRYLIYCLKIKSSSVFLHDTTAVSHIALLLFGGKLNVQHQRDCSILSVDNWIRFRCSKRHADNIRKLRAEIDSFLRKNIENPGNVSSWNWAKEHSAEGQLLDCISYVIDRGEKERALTFV